MDVTADWYWEGNVVEAVARFLTQSGWTIVCKADTHSKERGGVSTVTDDSLRLLATTELYLMKTTQAAFRVIVSP